MRRFSSGLRLSILAIGLWCAAGGTVLAAQFCVGTPAELTSALVLSTVNGQSNEIRVRQGSYNMSNGTGSNAGYYQFAGSLTLSGGWNADCSTRVLDPMATVINGMGSNESLWGLLSNASITLDGLRFQGAGGLQLGDRSSQQCHPAGQKISVRRLRVENAVDALGSISSLLIESRCHQVRVENTLITGGALPGLSLWCSGAMSFNVVNTTIRDTAGASLVASDTTVNPCVAYGIGSNRLYNNLIEHLALPGTSVLASHNIFDQLSASDGGGLFPGSGNNLIQNPQLDADYRPIEPTSPAINSGTDSVPGGLPGTDISGALRVVGGTVDRGAYESAVVPPGPFVITVTSQSDSGTGTLRDAIAQANASAGLNLVQFDIAGDCPRMITLASPLPEITESVIINGFSQPGASFNTLDHGNNSVLCIGIRASQLVDVPWALRVPANSSATLKVRGFGFGGFDSGGGLFGQAAIVLQGGSGHQIQGNQFGGPFHSVTLATSSEGVRLMNNATTALIGGSSPASRNTISGNSVAGVHVIGADSGGHQIINNYIGTHPGGVSAVGNFDGIRLIQTSNNKVLDNLISGNTRDGIVIAGESATSNLIAGNRIGGRRGGFLLCGIPPLPPCPPTMTNRKGILIESEASNNTIGAGGPQGAPNTIRHSTQHGIRVLSGRRNRLLSNSLNNNGTGANELDIDIDAFGLGGIDSDCGAVADARANRGQNRPVIGAALGNGNQLSVTGSLSSCTNTGGFDAVYRVQFFASSGCAANGHGPGQYFIGDHNVLLSGTDQTDVSEPFEAELEHPWLNLGGMYITATATDFFGNTSEFSQCVQADLSDAMFSDRFEQ